MNKNIPSVSDCRFAACFSSLSYVHASVAQLIKAFATAYQSVNIINATQIDLCCDEFQICLDPSDISLTIIKLCNMCCRLAWSYVDQ